MREDMTGQKFGRWTVMSDPGSGPKVLCRCSCGTEHMVVRTKLRYGGSLSCGCANREAVSFALRRRAHRHGFSAITDYRFGDDDE